jgi:hypothetical protein
MIVEEIYEDEKDITKVMALFCGNQARAKIKDRDLIFSVRFKEIKSGQVYFSSVESTDNSVSLDDYHMRPLATETVLGGNIYLFQAIPVSARSIAMPDLIKAHPKRKHPRIKVSGNPVISKMYATISMKVVDFTVQDEELARKIHLIISTIESHLVRSENYDIAKVSLFDGTEKNIVTRLIKKTKKPFVVLDSNNFKVKDELVLGYEDYIKFLIEEGYKRDDIMSQLDKVKEFYIKNHILSEAIIPLVFEDEAIGQIRVVSLKEKIAKAQIRRLMSLAMNAVENLFEKCSFEILSKEPQIVLDLSVGGGKLLITETDMFKYIRLLKRIYIQLYFPDESMIKTMATVINTYDNTEDGFKTIGVKFSANIDWRDKQKLDDFIQSVLRLEKDYADEE